jgi:hypothetical protein
MPLSYGSNITMRNITLNCDIFFDVSKSDQYILSDFTFENLNIQTKTPDIYTDHITNFYSKECTNKQ